MITTYVIEVETRTPEHDRDYIEKMNGGIILNFLEKEFEISRIGIYRGIKRLKGTTKRW